MSNSARSSLPPSDAQDRLDDSVRMLLEAADDLNGGRTSSRSGGPDGDVHRISMLNTRLVKEKLKCMYMLNGETY